MSGVESKKKSYRINVKTLEGRILKFTNVESYKIKEGMLIFIDSKTSILKQFPQNNCEIEGGEEDG